MQKAQSHSRTVGMDNADRRGEEEETTNYDMQEYLALKAAVKGEIRSAQGRTWRRQLHAMVQAVVVQPVKQHPIVAGEFVVALAIVSFLFWGFLRLSSQALHNTVEQGRVRR